jgi:hypothetical protein
MLLLLSWARLFRLDGLGIKTMAAMRSTPRLPFVLGRQFTPEMLGLCCLIVCL